MAKRYHSMNGLSRGNFHFVGVLHERPRSHRHGRQYASGIPASLFGKGEGFALAGTGDAVETLSRE
nr:MAG TPA: hypothetical protein [Inoviridae sp.]